MKLPIIVAPMFLVSTPEFVIESCRAGVIGSFPLLNARPIEECEKWLQEIKDALPDQPWAVNFACHRKTNKRYDEDLELIKKYEPPIVLSSLGHPGELLEVVHSYGGKVFADVITVTHAKKSVDAGVDGLILVCSGAGGHGGTLNPFAFFHEVRAFFNGTLILAGAISTGSDILAAEVLGAEFVYMGTRFLNASETSAPEEYQQMVIEATIDDILYTNAFSGVYANMLIPSIVKSGIDPKTLKHREDIDLNHLLDAKAWKDIWSAGQGVGTVQKVEPVRDIITTLSKEYDKAREKLTSLSR